GGVQALHKARHVIAGIAIADISAKRAAIAHLRIGDLQRSLPDDRTGGGKLARCDQLVLRGHRSNLDLGFTLDFTNSDAFQLANMRDVDKVAGLSEPQLHHGNKAVTSGQDTPVAASLAQKLKRLNFALRPVVVESGRNHRPPPAIMAFLLTPLYFFLII